MSTASEKIIESYFESFNGGYLPRMLELLDEGVVHDTHLLKGEKGKKAFEAFLSRQAECYQERVHDIIIMSEASGKYAAAQYNITGTYRKTEAGQLPARGQVYTVRGGTFFEFTEDKISRITSYYNIQEWNDQIR